jgi:hypothetical protein
MRPSVSISPIRATVTLWNAYQPDIRTLIKAHGAQAVLHMNEGTRRLPLFPQMPMTCRGRHAGSDA